MSLCKLLSTHAVTLIWRIAAPFAREAKGICARARHLRSRHMHINRASATWRASRHGRVTVAKKKKNIVKKI